MPRSIATLALWAGLLVAAASPQSRPKPGPVAACDYCGMAIEQPRFGGRMQTFDRRSLRFDATECMAAFTLRPRDGALAAVGLWSVRYDRPGAEIDARQAVYLLSDSLASPMGLGLSAFADRRTAEALRAKVGGRLLDWTQVVERVRERWFPPLRR
jgi:nitrous oxide reductase accessory protein NosL